MVVFSSDLPSTIAFPFSHHGKTRKLNFRNATNHLLFVKIVPSSKKLIGVERRGFLMDRLFKESIKLQLKPEFLEGSSKISDDENTGHNLEIYCICADGRSTDEVRKWVKKKNHSENELAFSLSIHRSKDFAALETVLDMPGNASLIYSVPNPRYKVDDRFCFEAHRIDSDTKTAYCLSVSDQLTLLPPNSIIETARDITVNRCWLFRIFDVIFPPHSVSDFASEANIRPSPESIKSTEVSIKSGEKLLFSTKSTSAIDVSTGNIVDEQLPCGAANYGAVGVVQ